MRTHISFIPLFLLLCGCLSSAPLDESKQSFIHIEQQEDKSIAVGNIVKTLDSKGILEFGNKKAKNTLIVFTEYHCTYCMEFHREYFEEIQNTFIDSDDLRVQFIPFHINKYPNSANINKGLLCAIQMGKGKEMHTELTHRQEEQRITANDYATTLELDTEVFSECMQNEAIDILYTHQQKVAKQLGIERVPTFIINEEIKTGLPQKANMMGWIRQAIQ